MRGSASHHNIWVRGPSRRRNVPRTDLYLVAVLCLRSSPIWLYCVLSGLKGPTVDNSLKRRKPDEPLPATLIQCIRCPRVPVRSCILSVVYRRAMIVPPSPRGGSRRDPSDPTLRRAPHLGARAPHRYNIGFPSLRGDLSAGSPAAYHASPCPIAPAAPTSTGSLR